MQDDEIFEGTVMNLDENYIAVDIQIPERKKRFRIRRDKRWKRLHEAAHCVLLFIRKMVSNIKCIFIGK